MLGDHQDLDRLVADPDLPDILGLSPRKVRHQVARVRARSGLSLFRVCFNRRQSGQALKWLVKAMRFYPPILSTDGLFILEGFRDVLHARIGGEPFDSATRLSIGCVGIGRMSAAGEL